MAGTVVASYLNDGTTSGSTTDMVKGSARAWVNFNGTGTVAIRASYNVSSITDNGTGDYTLNFTTAFVDTSYAHAIGSKGYSGSGVAQWIGENYGRARTTSTLSVGTTDYLNTDYRDAEQVCISVFR